MERDWIGYLIGALEPDEQTRLDDYFAASPKEATRLATLQQVLEPLEADRDSEEPPTDLYMRTISTVAGYMVANDPIPTDDNSSFSGEEEEYLPAVAPVFTVEDDPVPTPLKPYPAEVAAVQWTEPLDRRNLLTLAGLTVALVALLVPAIASMRHYGKIHACQQQLRTFAMALSQYAEQNDRNFPQIAFNEGAGAFARTLSEDGFLPAELSMNCPGSGNVSRWRVENGYPTAQQIEYAYTLGYRNTAGDLCGLDRQPENEHVPLLADVPQRHADEHLTPIYHKRGYNVLFAGGHVKFCTTPNVGIEGDNIFINQERKVSAGTHRWDAVLGRADEMPGER